MGERICPKCKRTFSRKNQSHYCGEKAKTIDEYIRRQDPDLRERLLTLDQAISEAIPEAKRRIAWNMPTYTQKSNIIHFAVFKNHIGIYPGKETLKAFAEELKDRSLSASSLHLPLDEAFPLALIQRMAQYSAKNG